MLMNFVDFLLLNHHQDYYSIVNRLNFYNTTDIYCPLSVGSNKIKKVNNVINDTNQKQNAISKKRKQQ
jgi:hypothetical protein